METMNREPREACEKSLTAGFGFKEWFAYFTSIGADEELADWLASEIEGQEDI